MQEAAARRRGRGKGFGPKGVQVSRTGRWIATLTAISCLLAFSQAPVTAQSLLTEDFESYTAGTWPATWVPDANAHQTPENGVGVDPQDPNNQALRIFGALNACWGALAFHPCTFPESFAIDVRVYNGTESLGGCHPQQGCVYLREGTSWHGASRLLLIFMGDGTVKGVNGQVLPGTYVSGQWYHVRIAYRQSGTDATVDYWLDGSHLGTYQETVTPFTFTHFELTVQEGSAWFDDVILIGNDCNGNGIPDDQDLAAGTSADCNSNGIPDECDIAGGFSDDANHNGFPDECECPSPIPYCSAEINSNGTSAQIGSNGQVILPANDFVLTIDGATPGQVGIFLYAQHKDQVPWGEGTLCLQAPRYRLPPVVLIDASGAASYAVDFTAPPAGSGPGAIYPFSTWNFQFLYRDPSGGPTGFNASNGLEATFCP